MNNLNRIFSAVLLLVLLMGNSGFQWKEDAPDLALLPDLKVMAINVDGSNPCYGDALNSVKVTLFNAGQASTKPGVPVSLRIDPLRATYRETLKLVLAPNTFKTVIFKRVKFRPGDNRITAIVNAGKKHQETNYQNNGKTISTKVTTDCDAVLQF